MAESSIENLKRRIQNIDEQLQNPPDQSASDVEKWRTRLQAQRNIYSQYVEALERGEISDVDVEQIASQSLAEGGKALERLEISREQSRIEKRENILIPESQKRLEKGIATEKDIKRLEKAGKLYTPIELKRLEVLERQIKGTTGQSRIFAIEEYNLIASKGREKYTLKPSNIFGEQTREEKARMSFLSQKDLDKGFMTSNITKTPYKTLTLTTGTSMDPYIPAGTKLAVIPFVGQDLKVGDVIRFEYKPYEKESPFTIHEVVGFEGGFVITKGYANKQTEKISRDLITDVIVGKYQDYYVKDLFQPEVTRKKEKIVSIKPKQDILTGFVSKEPELMSRLPSKDLEKAQKKIDKLYNIYNLPEKLKESYKKLDIKLGGLLPFGISPKAPSGKIRQVIATEVTEEGKPTGRRVLVPQEITIFEEFESKILTGKGRQKYTSSGITILGGAVSTLATALGKPVDIFLEAGREKAGKVGRGGLIAGKFALVESIPYVRDYVIGSLVAKQGGEFIKDPFKFTTETIRYAREEPYELIGVGLSRPLRKTTLDPLQRRLFGTTPDIIIYERISKEYLAEKGKTEDIVRFEAGTDFYRTIRTYQPKGIGFELKTEFKQYLTPEAELVLLSDLERVGKKGGEIFGSASYPKYTERLAGDIDIGKIPTSIRETFVLELYKELKISRVTEIGLIGQKLQIGKYGYQEGFGFGRPKALETHPRKTVIEYAKEEIPFGLSGKLSPRLLESFPYSERAITQPSVLIPKGFGDIGLFDIRTIKLREQFQRKVAGGTIGARAKDITDVSTMMGNIIKDFEMINKQGFYAEGSIKRLKRLKERFEQPELFVKDVSLPDFRFSQVFKEIFTGKTPKVSERFIDLDKGKAFEFPELNIYGKYKPSKIPAYTILTTPRAGAYSLLDISAPKQYKVIEEDYKLFDYSYLDYQVPDLYKAPSYKVLSYKTPDLYKLDIPYKTDIPYKQNIGYKQDIPYKQQPSYIPPDVPIIDIPYVPYAPRVLPPEIPKYSYPPSKPSTRKKEFPDFFDLKEEIIPKKEKIKPISRKYTYAPDLAGIFFRKRIKEPRKTKTFFGLEERPATEKELSISPFKEISFNIFKEAKAEFGFPKATAKQERQSSKRKSFIQRLGKGILNIDLGGL